MKCKMNVSFWSTSEICDIDFAREKLKSEVYEYECENKREGVIKGFKILFGTEEDKDILNWLVNERKIEEKDIDNREKISELLEELIYYINTEAVISKWLIGDEYYINEDLMKITEELLDEWTE